MSIKRMNKYIYYITRAIVCIVISACMLNSYGCKNKNNDSEVVEFTFYNADAIVDDPWTDPIAKKITEKTNVKIKTQHPDNDNEKDDKIAMMIASGKYPDIIYAKEDSQALVSAQALIDMSDLIDKYGSNIKKIYGDEFERLRYSKDNKAIYQLCSKGVNNNIYETSGNVMMQFDVLKANNYEIPKTLEQYEKYLQDYMKENPTIDDQPTIGLSACCSDWRWLITLANPAGFIADGSVDNGQWVVDEQNEYKCVYKHTSAKQKEYFRWMNKMYNEGILDKEFATQTYEDYLSKISSGRVLSLMDQEYDITYPLAILNKEKKYNRTYAPLPLMMNSDDKCTTLFQQGLPIGWGIGITKSCKEPEKVIKFIDYLCSEEGQILTHWGIEGTNYIVEDGKRIVTDVDKKQMIEDKDYKKKTGVEFHTYPFPSYGDGTLDSTGNTFTTVTKESTIQNYNPSQKECLKKWNVDIFTDIFPQPNEFSKASFAPLWSQMYSTDIKKTEQDINEIARTDILDCIVCSPSKYNDKWDKLQSDLKKSKVDELSEKMTNIVRENVEFTKNARNKKN